MQDKSIIMKKIITGCIIALCMSTMSMANHKTIHLRVIQTSDVHGSFFPYDFINRKPKSGSMARVISYVDSLRTHYEKNLLLLDNGDILQGQPTCYYYNYVKSASPNVAASVINYMKYDAQTVGNHDIETGHNVYDKWISEVKCPILGANVIDTRTGKPYLHPYTIVEREGVKVAILGLLTPAIPNWLNEKLWSNLRFDSMVKSARYWIAELKKNEKPDIIIGLFHSGKDGGIITDTYEENASLRIAKEVAGFDLILFGHDHTPHSSVIENVEGKKVVCLNPANNARMVADAEIEITLDNSASLATHHKRVLNKQVSGKLVDIREQPINQAYIEHFQSEIDSVKSFVTRQIGAFKRTIYSRDSYFGSAPFTDLIHNLQLRVTGADLSFNAPLAFDAQIKAGSVYVSDLFNLYKYENQIYVLKMTGQEIKNYLEMSYDLWVNTMTSDEDHIMLIDNRAKADQQRYGFKNLAFNFDSAAGIDYEVDVTKPNGNKVNILKMSNGEPFDLHKTYKVAMNSYRGNGGGELLTRGAGIPLAEIPKRILVETQHDQRYYLMKWIEESGEMDPQANNNWKFVPEKWTQPAIQRDKTLIFGQSKREDDNEK